MILSSPIHIARAPERPRLPQHVHVPRQELEPWRDVALRGLLSPGLPHAFCAQVIGGLNNIKAADRYGAPLCYYKPGYDQ